MKRRNDNTEKDSGDVLKLRSRRSVRSEFTFFFFQSSVIQLLFNSSSFLCLKCTYIYNIYNRCFYQRELIRIIFTDTAEICHEDLHVASCGLEEILILGTPANQRNSTVLWYF